MKKLAEGTRRVRSVSPFHTDDVTVVTDEGYESDVPEQTDYVYMAGPFAEPGGVTFDGIPMSDCKALVNLVSTSMTAGHDVLVELHPRVDLYGASTRAEFTCPALTLD